MSQPAKKSVFNSHSLNENERHEALSLIADEGGAEASRELIQVFFDSQWRETRLFILEKLGERADSRAFEFLSEFCIFSKDIPLTERAVQSLGRLRHPLAKKFLVEYYKHGPLHLKPAVVMALTEARELSLLDLFHSDLKAALVEQQQYLTKNLVYALGELKYAPAAETFCEIIRKSVFRDLRLSALMSLGKISRDANVVKPFASIFSRDSFEFQIYQNVKNQIQQRSGWKAEDYLQKLFSGESYHASMPLELNTFPEQDVKAGLDLFFTAERTEEMKDILSKLRFSGVKRWALEFGIPSEQVYVSENKIEIVNAFQNEAMVHWADTKKFQAFVKQAEAALLSETEIEVQGRWLRALAHLSASTPKVNSFVKQNLFKKELVASCLFYLEKAKTETETLLLFLENDLVKEKFVLQFLRTLQKQSGSLLKEKKFDAFLSETAASQVPEIQKAVLQVLQSHPVPSLKNFALELLKSKDPSLQIHAVIALKSYRDEKTADDVSKLLKSELVSLRGRALDTLFCIPGVRAKRLVFDHFLDYSDDPDVVEQVCRRFEPEENSSEYFFTKLGELIAKHPDHLQKVQLEELKEKLFAGLQSGKNGAAPDKEVQAIDEQLAKKISFYNQCDESSKSALRSAELPVVHPEMYSSYVDKSSSILGYSKALDIILEKQLGRRFLFPRLESRLHDFQNSVHLFELNDPHPSYERVVKNLWLEKHFTQQSLPLHKMSVVGQGILNSKIINEHFKILDGLRAWAVVLLMFSRKTPLVQKPLLHLTDDSEFIIALSKKLMWLQDLRNPVAHRQTLSDFRAVEEVRTEVIAILNSLNKLLKS